MHTPFVSLTASISLHDPINPELLCLCGQLSQSGIPEINSMVIHMRDHPEKSEEEAARDIRGIVDSSMKQLVQHVFTPSSAPMACKHVFLDNAKTAYYLYTDTDGWTSPSAKMQHHLNQLLFNRVL